MAIIYGYADSEKRLLDKLPNEVKSVDDIERIKKQFVNKWGKERYWYNRKGIGGKIFSGMKRWHYKRQVDKFQYKKIGKLRTGTYGENDVIDKLSKLDDSYHILCDVGIELPHWVTYNGRKNLKSAQIDLVVVCQKGVFMIEIKNWSDKYAEQNNRGLNPYEQTERAGRVLWITLQNEFEDDDFRVTNVLLSIRGNLPYNQNYRSVFVSSLNGINQFLEKRQNILDKEDIDDLVEALEVYT